jgi:hypothetical protein
METIQLLKPEHESCTEELQAFQWPDKSEAVRDFSEQTESAGDAFEWDARKVTSDDRSIPRPVCMAWEGIRALSENLVYDLLISRDAALEDPMVIKDIAEPCRNVVNLHTGTQYFWKVIARDRDSVLAVSAVWAFTTHSSTPRWLHVPGITNVRDMGGWRLPGNQRIRQGLVYRSSEMNGRAEITDEGKKVLIEELKIRTDLDLRRIVSLRQDPRAVLDQTVVNWINIPIGPYGAIVADDSREKYRQIFTVFSDPSAFPILFHCVGGCDRSGTIAFLLHGLLGLDSDSLIRDYELSSLSIFGERSRSSDEFLSLLSALLPLGDGKDDIGKQVENYLLSIGVTAEEIVSIRTHLIEQLITDNRPDAGDACQRA